MPFSTAKSARALVLTLLVALQLILQPAAVLAAAAAAGGSMEMGDDCAGGCAVSAVTYPEAGCCSGDGPVGTAVACCCDGDQSGDQSGARYVPVESSNETTTLERECGCVTPADSVPAAPRMSLEGTAAAGACEYRGPLTALPGVIDVECLGVHGVARARAPGTLRRLTLLHQVYRI